MHLFTEHIGGLFNCNPTIEPAITLVDQTESVQVAVIPWDLASHCPRRPVWHQTRVSVG